MLLCVIVAGGFFFFCVLFRNRNVDDRSISVRLFDDNGFDIGEEINCIIDCISA